jgi:hypothetical protein
MGERSWIVDRIGRPVFEQLATGLTGSELQLEHPYHSGGLRYRIWVTAADGSEIPLVDGGVFEWLAQLTANRRLVHVATGAGAQLIAWRFRTRP